jgi:hypothetical protein
MTRICWIPLGLTIALLSAFPLASAEERLWLVTEPSEGMPTCEEFFDNWEVQGAPSGLMTMSGFAREVFAAKERVDKGDVATACRHWQGLLVVMDKVGPPLSESRGDVENLMREKQMRNSCRVRNQSSDANGSRCATHSRRSGHAGAQNERHPAGQS